MNKKHQLHCDTNTKLRCILELKPDSDLHKHSNTPVRFQSQQQGRNRTRFLFAVCCVKMPHQRHSVLIQN